jgi:hypothetical protein
VPYRLTLSRARSTIVSEPPISEKLSALHAPGGPPEPKAVADLRSNGLTGNPEWGAELTIRHGLKLLGE